MKGDHAASLSLAARGALVVLLTAGFHVVTLGLLVAIALASFRGLLDDDPDVYFAFVALPLVMLGAWCVLPWSPVVPAPGIPVDADEHSDLLHVLRDAAAAVGREPPTAVHLTADVNVGTHHSSSGLWSARTLCIGLPLLLVLRTTELRALLSDELTRWGSVERAANAWIRGTSLAIFRTATVLGRVLGKPFAVYGRLQLRAVNAFQRRRSLSADRLAARVSDEGALAGALRTVTITKPLFDHYFQFDYAPVLEENVRPPLLEGFRLFLRSESAGGILRFFVDGRAVEWASPYDAAPPLSRRLVALGEREPTRDELIAVLRLPERSALELLRDPGEVESRLAAQLVGADRADLLQPRSWREVASDVLPEVWRKVVNRFAGGLPRTTVAEFADQQQQLASLGRHFGMKLEVARPAAGAELLATLLAHALHLAGFAVVASPGGHPVLVRGDTTIEPSDLALRLASGRLEPTAWRALCKAEGVGELPLTGTGALTLRPADLRLRP